MAYSTVQQVRDASGLTDSTNVPDAYITSKISFADARINGAIARRYSLPLASTPDLIEHLSIQIAVALLFLDQYGEEAEDTDKGWEKRLKSLMAELEAIRTGDTILVDDTTGAELSRSTTNLPSSYPNDTSSDPAATDTTAPQIKMTEKW